MAPERCCGAPQAACHTMVLSAALSGGLDTQQCRVNARHPWNCDFQCSEPVRLEQPICFSVYVRAGRCWCQSSIQFGFGRPGEVKAGASFSRL